MSRLAVFLMLLALAAGDSSDAIRSAGDPGGRQAWRVAGGRPPSAVEYAAVLAACRDGAIVSARGEPIAACLADLGLRRAEKQGRGLSWH